jgi:ADP-ribose pyrophosphatase
MPEKKKLEAKVVDVKRVFNSFFKMDRYEIEMDRHEGGKQRVVREIFERGHAVGILAYDPLTDMVVLVNEMRPGILAAGGYPYTDTLPAGGIAQGETDIAAAVRETREETGLELKNPEVIHAGSYVSPGGTSEKISIVFGIVDASRAGGVFGNEDEKENIKTSAVTSDELMRRIRSGDINDMKTMLAGYWLMENRARLQKAHAVANPKQKPPQP